MNVIVNDSTLMLEPSQTIELVDAAGAIAAVATGCLWITMDGDRRDIVMRSGDRWEVERNGRTLVHAQTASTIRLIEPQSPNPERTSGSLVAKARHALQAATAHLLSLRRPVPYY